MGKSVGHNFQRYPAAQIQKTGNRRYLVRGCLEFHIVACNKYFCCWYIQKIWTICNPFPAAGLHTYTLLNENKSAGDHIPFSGNESAHTWLEQDRQSDLMGTESRKQQPDLDENYVMPVLSLAGSYVRIAGTSGWSDHSSTDMP